MPTCSTTPLPLGISMDLLQVETPKDYLGIPLDFGGTLGIHEPIGAFVGIFPKRKWADVPSIAMGWLALDPEMLAPYPQGTTWLSNGSLPVCLQ